MFDKEVAREALRQITIAIQKIRERFATVKNISDFTGSSFGMEKMDSICMQLIVIGESIKNLDKITNGELLTPHTEINWRQVKGMRDIITHHYGQINAEVIFNTCRNNIPELALIIEKITKEIE